MYVKVKVTPGSRKESVVKRSYDHFEISVKEKAENNRANDRVLEIIRSLYKGKVVRMVTGHHSRGKILSIDDVDEV